MAVRTTETTQNVTIAAAKGRPMLTWVGKRPLGSILARPAQHMETFDPTGELASSSSPMGRDGARSSGSPSPRKGRGSGGEDLWEGWPTSYPKGGLLLYGDNKEVLASLIAQGFRGKVKLIYIDPPFDSGADYVRKVQLRGAANVAALDGEGQSLIEQVQYADIWANDTYLQFMYERLLLLKELLSDDGSIYVQCDWHRSHYLRVVMDEVFGPERLLNEITWQRTSSHNDPGRFGNNADYLLAYTRSEDYTWNTVYTPYTDEYIEDNYRYADADGRRWRPDNLTSPQKDRPNLTYDWKGVTRVWRYTRERMEELDRQERIVYSSTGYPQYKRYLDEMPGAPAQCVWADIRAVNNRADEYLGFPTQKPETLLDRIICASSNPGDIVLDCFIGSGTTAAVAQKLGRRWIGCDINKGAIQTTSRRLQGVIRAQIASDPGAKQEALIEGATAEETPPEPAQRAFTLWRVNDYDLQIQHNEAVALVSEYLGVERTRSDGFFDGTLGNKLVKVVPFDHPLGPLDLEAVKRELEARGGEETRTVVMVCLGKQLAADDWLGNWNKFRAVTKLEQGTNAPVEFVNKIEVIDVRGDPKYGGFIAHEPARAEVHIERQGENIAIRIEDFISPTIVQRLQMDMGLFRAQVTDWRAMVNSVEVDTAYTGEALNITLSDIPEKKSDLVSGTYTLPAPAGETTVAVKITDMLGEEVLATARV